MIEFNELKAFTIFDPGSGPMLRLFHIVLVLGNRV